jgi:hypothetical protein
VFWDESGASLLPVTRRTWAPRGVTPVIDHHFKWKRCSMAAALCYGSGGGAQLAFHHQLDAYNTPTLIGALGELCRALGGQKATLLWDGLPAHRSLAMAAWLRRQRSWLVVEPLPGYAPELNPVEALTLLYMSSGLGRVLRGHVVQHGEDLAGHVALQAADDLGLGLALLGAPGQVVPGGLVPA